MTMEHGYKGGFWRGVGEVLARPLSAGGVGLGWWGSMGREGLWSVGRPGGRDGLWGRRGSGRVWLVARWDHGLVRVHRDRLDISFVELGCSGVVRTGVAGWTTRSVFPPTFLCRSRD